METLRDLVEMAEQFQEESNSRLRIRVKVAKRCSMFSFVFKGRFATQCVKIPMDLVRRMDKEEILGLLKKRHEMFKESLYIVKEEGV